MIIIAGFCDNIVKSSCATNIDIDSSSYINMRV